MNAAKIFALPIFLILSLQLFANAFLLTGVTIAKVTSWASTWSDFVKTGDTFIPEIAEKYLEAYKTNSVQSCKYSPQPIDVFISDVHPALFALSHQLSDIEAKFRSGIDNFHNVTEGLKLDIEQHSSLTNLQGVMDSVAHTFDNLLANLVIAEQSDSVALRSEACDNINRNSLQNEMNNLLNSLDAEKSRLKTVGEIIVQKLKTEPQQFCGAGLSTHEYLYSIYTSVILTEVRAFAIQVFYVYLLSKDEGKQDNCVFNENKSDLKVKILQDSLKEHLAGYTGIFTDAMQQVSRDHRACDEGRLEQDETFIELTGAAQTIVQYLDLPDVIRVRYELEDHDNLCKYFNPNPTPYACIQKDLPWCLTDLRRPCFGDVSTCNAIRDIKICLTTDDSRRYQWLTSHMTYKNVTSLTCPDKPIEIKDHVCLCQCHDYGIDSISTHLFNLQSVESDTAENKIVTGVRFMVKNNVIQFQIQQGTLGAYWNVSDVSWKEVKDISEKIRYSRLDSKLRGEFPNLTEYTDFLIIDTLIGTEINLDRLIVRHGYVLTGVQLVAQAPSDDEPKRVRIALITTKFDYETGQLHEEKETIANYSSHIDELIYNTQNVNTSITPLVKHSTVRQFVTIKPSDWRTADAGQTTLPYFDAKSVETKPPSPIGGLELFYKTKKPFTGMLSLVLVSLDYAEYMNDSLQKLNAT